MARGVELVVKILTDASNATAGIKEASGRFGQFRQSMADLAVPAGVVAGAVAAVGTKAVAAASELQQSMGGVDAVFGQSADQIRKWAAGAAESVGLTQAEYGNFAAVVGAQLKNLGVPMDQVAGNTNSLISLGADLAATYGGTTQEAVNALSAALRGEADPAERYGLALNATRVNAEMAAQGLTGLEGEALTAAKAQTIMQLATEQAGGAIGQFDRESNTLAGTTQRMQAAWGDAAAALGNALLPYVTAVAGAFQEMAGWVQQNASWLVPLGVAIGAVAGAILAINVALAAYRAIQTAVQAVTTLVTVAQNGLNAAMAANPIGIIIGLVAALVAGFMYLWNTNEGFRNAFITGWEQIKSFFSGVWNAIKSVFDTVMSAIMSATTNVINSFRTGWQQISTFFSTIWRGMQNVVNGVIGGIRNVVSSVTGFFQSAWNNAVNAVNAVVRTLQSVFSSVMNAVLAPIRAVKSAFDAIVGAVQNVINWISRIKIPSFGDLFGGGGGRMALNVGGGGLMRAMAAPAYSGPGTGAMLMMSRAEPPAPTTTITVQGGLDSSDAIARRIQQILGARTQRAGGVNLTRSAR